MLEREGERGNPDKEHSRETGIPNEEWMQPSRYRSAKRNVIKTLKEKTRKSKNKPNTTNSEREHVMKGTSD